MPFGAGQEAAAGVCPTLGSAARHSGGRGRGPVSGFYASTAGQ